MKKITLVLLSGIAAIAVAQVLPALWSQTANSVCGTQVARNGTYSVSLEWAGVPYWGCTIKENGHTKQINLGWYPVAEPKDKI